MEGTCWMAYEVWRMRRGDVLIQKGKIVEFGAGVTSEAAGDEEC